MYFEFFSGLMDFLQKETNRYKNRETNEPSISVKKDEFFLIF